MKNNLLVCLLQKLIYISLEKQTVYPITVQIREVENGRHGFGKCLLMHQRHCYASINASTTSATATTFTFDSVFLKNYKDYCITIGRCW